jgi:hypothetical protein
VLVSAPPSQLFVPLRSLGEREMKLLRDQKLEE